MLRALYFGTHKATLKYIFTFLKNILLQYLFPILCSIKNGIQYLVGSKQKNSFVWMEWIDEAEDKIRRSAKLTLYSVLFNTICNVDKLFSYKSYKLTNF